MVRTVLRTTGIIETGDPMRHAVLAILLASALPSVSAAQSELPLRQQIEAAEAQVAKAIATKDTTALKRLWSARMIVNSPANNILTRDQVIAALGKGQLNYTGYKNEVEAFQSFGDDVAILMGHEELTRADGAYGGKPLFRRYTDLWQRTGAAWVQIARQATYTSAP